MNDTADHRHHVQSLLMRESLVDRVVMESTESPVVRMLPNAHVVKVGGRSILDAGRCDRVPVRRRVGRALRTKQLILGVGGGVRTRHVFSIGIDLGLPTGVLAQLVGGRCQRQCAHPRNAARAPRRRSDSARDVRALAALPGQRRSRRDIQRRSTLFALGASAGRRPHPASSHGRGLLSSRRMFRLQVAGPRQGRGRPVRQGSEGTLRMRSSYRRSPRRSWAALSADASVRSRVAEAAGARRAC